MSPACLRRRSTGVRLVTYSSCGVLIGWFANELREVAERDFLTYAGKLFQRNHRVGLN